MHGGGTELRFMESSTQVQANNRVSACTDSVILQERPGNEQRKQKACVCLRIYIYIYIISCVILKMKMRLIHRWLDIEGGNPNTFVGIDG